MSAFGSGGPARGTVFRDTLTLSSCAADGEGCTSTLLLWMATKLCCDKGVAQAEQPMEGGAPRGRARRRGINSNVCSNE